MPETLRIDYRNYSWFKKLDHMLGRLPFLEGMYDFVHDPEDPEVIFFGCSFGPPKVNDPVFGRKGTKRVPVVPEGPVRVFWTGENCPTDLSRCEFSLAFDRDIEDPRHFRFPNYVPWSLGNKRSPEMLLRTPDEDVDRLMAEKTKFCAFVHSHPVPFRNDFAVKLSEYKQVDFGGKCLNNIGGRVPNKIDFFKHYKFVIAFENSATKGYVTEKIADVMTARAVPIYWGDPTVGQDFNPGSFIHYRGFPNEEALIEHIIKVDNDDALYRQMLMAPYFHNNTLPPYADKRVLREVFGRIFHAAKART